MKKSYQSLEDQPILHSIKAISRYFISGQFILVLFVSSFSLTAWSQEGDIDKGKALFNQQCVACHLLDRKLIGPPLRNVEQRLADDEGLDRQWLYDWIKNNDGLIKTGDTYANIIKDYDASAMNAFATLSDEDIDNILAYTAKPKDDVGGDVTSTDATKIRDDSGISNKLILAALALLFMLLASGLFMVQRTLKRFAEAKAIEIKKEKRPSLWQAFVKNQFLLLVTAIFLLLASGYFVFGWMMQLGVDQGYQPVQPIHFSHKIHAGDNKIDCKYCHSSARVSKTSGIPSLNVCMNCHKSIYEYKGEVTAKYDKAFYDAEIKKLYKAVGWDENEQQYTGETKAVEWIRIHNLPDFAYFNHSQHVSVAGVQCQTCHGPVEEMEIVYQDAPLTMGWCIDCHRETEINVRDNSYYKKIHEELANKYGVNKLTVAQIGGLECGKCHY